MNAVQQDPHFFFFTHRVAVDTQPTGRRHGHGRRPAAKRFHLLRQSGFLDEKRFLQSGDGATDVSDFVRKVGDGQIVQEVRLVPLVRLFDNQRFHGRQFLNVRFRRSFFVVAQSPGRGGIVAAVGELDGHVDDHGFH